MFRIKEVSPTTFIVSHPFWLIFRLFGLSFIIVIGYEYDVVKTLSEARQIRNAKRWEYVYTKRNLKLV